MKEYQCSPCGNKFSIKGLYSSSKIECPACGHRFTRPPRYTIIHTDPYAEQICQKIPKKNT